MPARPAVVIIGAGFAGVECAKQLAEAPVDVLVLDRHNFHTFLPLLYQVATAGLAPHDVAYPARGLFHECENVRFRTGTVVGVDWDARRVLVEGEEDVPFDYLVVAAGASSAWLGVEGAAEHSLPLYDLGDAVRLRNHVLRQFELADSEGPVLSPGRLTFAVVGGGATGVEMAGALSELFVVLAKDFPAVEVGQARIVLIEAAGALLGSFSGRAQRHASAVLGGRGVDLRLDETVAEIDEHGLRLGSGEWVAARTVVWAAGVRANPLVDTLGVDQARGGRVVVDAELRVPGRTGVYAVGDVAAIAGRDGNLLPQLAPVAKQSGRFVAASIAASVPGPPATAPPRSSGDRPVFRFRDRGTMATVGRRSAVADLPGGVALTGTLAWLAWLLLHLVFLVGFRNRLSVLVNWAWNYVTYDRGPRLILGDGEPRPTTR